MNRLTNDELEIIIACVSLERIRLSPIPGNEKAKNIHKIIEYKLKKNLESRKINENT